MGCEVFFDISLGRPRTTRNIPDSFVYDLPGVIKKSKNSWFASKTAGYLLRSSHSPRCFENLKITSYLTRALASIILSIHFRKCLIIDSPKDLGFDPRFNPLFKRTLTIGYFQTFMYDISGRELQNSQLFPLTIQDERITEYRSEALTKPPLVVHVRKGDYALDDSFGILGASYYANAIAELQKFIDINNIWLFSDEPETALSVIPTEFHSVTKVIPEIGDSPALTLEVMRLGKNYIIANSTFSWWAAFSSTSTDTHVVAPSPWFKGMKSPNELVPGNWIKVDSHFL